jgi:hypothetical protein
MKQRCTPKKSQAAKYGYKNSIILWEGTDYLSEGKNLNDKKNNQD